MTPDINEIFKVWKIIPRSDTIDKQGWISPFN